jgi:hypothetical protein
MFLQLKEFGADLLRSEETGFLYFPDALFSIWKCFIALLHQLSQANQTKDIIHQETVSILTN